MAAFLLCRSARRGNLLFEEAATDVWDLHDAHAPSWIIHGPGERDEHLLERDEAEASGTFAERWHESGNRIERNERVRPAMSGAEHVPGPKYGGVEAGGADHIFAFGADFDIRMHHGRRMSDANVDEVLNASALCILDGDLAGFEIDGAKLCTFPGIGLGFSSKLQERVGTVDGVGIALGAKSVAQVEFATGGRFILRARTYDTADMMVPLKQKRDDAASHIARTASNENGCHNSLAMGTHCIQTFHPQRCALKVGSRNGVGKTECPPPKRRALSGEGHVSSVAPKRKVTNRVSNHAQGVGR